MKGEGKVGKTFNDRVN